MVALVVAVVEVTLVVVVVVLWWWWSWFRGRTWSHLSWWWSWCALSRGGGVVVIRNLQT